MFSETDDPDEAARVQAGIAALSETDGIGA
jgi:hypothetical protein